LLVHRVKVLSQSHHSLQSSRLVKLTRFVNHL
jgi:hypothetical protein